MNVEHTFSICFAIGFFEGDIFNEPFCFNLLLFLNFLGTFTES